MSSPSDSETALLASFIEMTGLDFDTASHYMQAAGYDISIAFGLLPETNTQGSNSGLSNQSSSSAAQDAFSQSLFPEESDVRAADPVQHTRLLGGGGGGSSFGLEREQAFARAEDPKVEWMFPPPNHLSFPAGLQEARSQARSDKKWILFNIQHHTEFSSHMLNRDVWTNETLVPLIRTNFLFWQRGSTSVDGKTFMFMHQISPYSDDLPLVGIIDPRTGGIVMTMKGSYDATDLTLRLIEFLDDNSMDSGRVPVARNYHVKPPGSAARADSDDEGGDKYVYEDDSDNNDEDGGDGGDAATGSVPDQSSSSSTDIAREYVKGDRIVYTSSSGVPSRGTIVAVHRDDEEVYYTVRVRSDDGEMRERQTDAGHLTPGTPSTGEDSDIAAAIAMSLQQQEQEQQEKEQGKTEGESRVAETLLPEPEEGSAGAVKVSVRLLFPVTAAGATKPSSSIVRRFLGDSSVSQLFAFVTSLLPPEDASKAFDLLTGYPRVSLRASMDKTMQEAGLAGGQVLMKWE